MTLPDVIKICIIQHITLQHRVITACTCSDDKQWSPGAPGGARSSQLTPHFTALQGNTDTLGRALFAQIKYAVSVSNTTFFTLSDIFRLTGLLFCEKRKKIENKKQLEETN